MPRTVVAALVVAGALALSGFDPGIGSLSITFTGIPAGPTDYLGAHGVVDATLPSVDGVAGPVALRVLF